MRHWRTNSRGWMGSSLSWSCPLRLLWSNLWSLSENRWAWDPSRTDVLLWWVLCRHRRGACLVNNYRRLQLLYSVRNGFRPQNFVPVLWIFCGRMGSSCCLLRMAVDIIWKAKKKREGKLSHPSLSMQYILCFLHKRLRYRYNIPNLGIGKDCRVAYSGIAHLKLATSVFTQRFGVTFAF